MTDLADTIANLTTQVQRIADTLTPPDAGDTSDPRTIRRDSIRHLLDRLDRGAMLTNETAVLRQHIEVEIGHADTARLVARSAAKDAADAISRAAQAEEKARAYLVQRQEIASNLEKEQTRRQALKAAHVALASQAGKDQAAIERVRDVCDYMEAAVRNNPTGPDSDGAYLAAIRHLRTALDASEQTSSDTAQAREPEPLEIPRDAAALLHKTLGELLGADQPTP